jgi:IS30 family transposase
MPGSPLSLSEREEIAVALMEDRSTAWAEIARRLARHPTTVMREVLGNGGRECYRPAIAERSADKRRCRPRQRRLARPDALRTRVATQLDLGRSPEAI